MQRICEAVVLDGTESECTHKMASFGHWGAQTQNIERDLHRYCVRSNLNAGIEAYQVETVVRDAAGQHKETCLPVLLPHELVNGMYQLSEADFQSRFVCSESLLSEFWAHHSSERWFHSHPARDKIMQEPGRSIPLRLFGDEAPMSKSQGVLLFAFCSSICRLPSWLSRWLTICVPTSLIIPDETLRPLLEVFIWSLTILMSGVMPGKNHKGEEFTAARDRRRRSLAGSRVAGPYLFYLCQIVGDWKWFREEFKLAANYGQNFCCWRCKATKDGTNGVPAYDFNFWAEWTKHPRTAQEYALVLIRSALTGIPGFDMDMLKCDLMHIVLLGVLLFANGGALWEMAFDYNVWPLHGPDLKRGWKSKMNNALGHAYLDFKDWLKKGASPRRSYALQ